MALCVGLGISRDPRSSTALAYVIPIFLIVTIGYLAPGVVGGAGLLYGQGWARVVIACVSGLMLTLFPVGTALGGVSLWVLFGRRQGADPPAPAPAPIPTTGRARQTVRAPSGVLGLLLAMAGVAAGFVVVIGVGFRLHHQTAPAAIGAAVLPALAVLAATIVAGVIGWRRTARTALGGPHGPTPARREALRREREAVAAEHRRRLAELAADPLRSRYVALIERGERWSDAQIAYDLDPAARVTCAHLQPIEGAMREAGLRVQPSVAAYANVEAVIDRAELARLYPDPQLGYSEFELGGRAYEDNPVAQIACAEHRSAIYALHPSEARADTPRFPAK